MAGGGTDRFAEAARVAPAERLGAALGDGADWRLGAARMGAAARLLGADFAPPPRWAWASRMPKVVDKVAIIMLAAKQ